MIMAVRSPEGGGPERAEHRGRESAGHVFDAAVIGAGVMGCSTALHLARGGMVRARICGAAGGADSSRRAGACGPGRGGRPGR